ncbi:uncharacterized protein LOC115797439 [Archocentrus centrarchus]|uniref:uncharacterized protein LOC115797439 n=1 Tax=Archocentrus centrarchus TaxID=63155 RepID=UPI0011E9D387|nr:uncharacterized protein LOC115797439 [Archocentrus centrarchus]
MVNFTLMLVLLCWISSSLAQFYTVEVQPGEDVTLRCSNLTSILSNLFWFKLNSSPSASCISSMCSSDSNVSFCDGFQNGKFSMTSNTTELFLSIKQVDLSDSGLYFCGEKNNGNSAFTNGTFSFLKVQEASDGSTHLLCVILGSLIVFLLLLIITVTVKIRKFHKAQVDGQNLQHSEIVESDAMNYAAVSFHPNAKIRKPAAQRELEPNVVYAATR